MAVIDSATGGNGNSDDWDWGYSLVPESRLSSQLIVGYAPGKPDIGPDGYPTDNGSLDTALGTFSHGNSQRLFACTGGYPELLLQRVHLQFQRSNPVSDVFTLVRHLPSIRSREPAPKQTDCLWPVWSGA